MSLTRAQKDTIETTLETMIDTPQSIDESDQLQKALFDVFAQKTDPSESMDLLWKCFANPTRYFKNLEKLGPGITIGEVQICIIECITTQLSSSGFPLTAWNHDYLINRIREQNSFSEPFVTEQEQPEDDFDVLELPTEEGSIFTGKVGHDTGQITDDLTKQEEPVLWPYVLITYHFPNEPEKVSKLHLSTPIFQRQLGNEIDEMTYFDDLVQEGYAIASTRATIEALTYLIKHGVETSVPRASHNDQVELVNDHGVPHLSVNGAASLLLTHRFYFEKILNREITYQQLYSLNNSKANLLLDATIMQCIESGLPGLQFSELMAYNNNELTILTHPGVLELMKHGLLQIAQAKILSNAALKIITHPVYYALLKNQTIALEKIVNITDQQASLCVVPSITNLIQKQKVTLEQILSLPPQAKQVFVHTGFQELLSRSGVNPAAIMELDTGYYQLLAKPAIMKSLVNGQEAFTDFLDLPREKIHQFLSSSSLYQLLDQDHLKLRDLIEFKESDKPATLLKGLCSALDTTANHAKVPDQLDKGKIKEIAHLIENSAKECAIDQQKFIYMVAHTLVCTIQATLTNIVNKTHLDQFDPILSKLMDFLDEKASSDNPYWISAYDEAGQYAKLIIKKINAKSYQTTASENENTQNHQLFQNNNTATNDSDSSIKIIKSACNTILSASQLIGTLLQNNHLFMMRV